MLTAIGEITGTFPAATISLTAFVSTEAITPTKPRSAGVPSTRVVSGSAIKVPEVLPDTATAFTP